MIVEDIKVCRCFDCPTSYSTEEMTLKTFPCFINFNVLYLMSSSGYCDVAGSCVEILPELWPTLQSPFADWMSRNVPEPNV